MGSIWEEGCCFVNRQEDPAERRHVLLTLTQMGRERLEEIRNSTRHQIATLLDELTPQELKQVATGLTILGRVFDGSIHNLTWKKPQVAQVKL